MPVTSATFKVHYPEFQVAFENWRKLVKLDIVDAWRKQGKLIAERLIGGIGGASGWNRATPPGTRKQGENAMSRDIKRSIFPLKASGFRDVKLRKRVQVAVREEDVATLQGMVKNGVFGAAMVQAKVLPAGNEYTAHQNSRVSRGRVTRQTPGFAEPGDAYLKQYIAEGKSAVGQGKGGWVSSLNALGGKCAEWISRHVKNGTFIDELKPGSDSMRFSMINKSKWASGGDEDRIIDTVLGDRTESIKADIKFRIESSFKTGRRVVV
jgi:hypothetical protein